MTKILSLYKGDGLVETRIGKHLITSDKPRSLGGHDRSPTPIELLITSLSTCVSMVISTYCEEHAIDATDLQVEIHYQTDAYQKQITCLNVHIEVPYGDIHNREQALQRVAEHCTVYTNLKNLEHIQFSIIGRKEITNHIW